MAKQVDKSHYDFMRYVDVPRFISFYHQLRYVYQIGPGSMLEVGCGNNFLRKVLAGEISYTSVDLDPDLNPDIVAALPKLPIASASFDLVVCFQVLEHLPFELFEESIRELCRVSRGPVVISLPYARFKFQIAINVPRLKWRRIAITLPHRHRVHHFNGEHHWVIGTRHFPLRRITDAMKRHCDLVETFSPFEKQEHMFFRLQRHSKKSH